MSAGAGDMMEGMILYAVQNSAVQSVMDDELDVISHELSRRLFFSSWHTTVAIISMHINDARTVVSRIFKQMMWHIALKKK